MQNIKKKNRKVVVANFLNIQTQTVVSLFWLTLPYRADGQISRGDFIDYKKKQFDHQMSQEDHEDTDLEFRLADRDGNGVIDWWEFLNYQAKKKLALRDQVQF